MDKTSVISLINTERNGNMPSAENAYKVNEYVMVFPEHVASIEVQFSGWGQFAGEFEPEPGHTHYLVVHAGNEKFIVGSGTREGCLNQKDMLRKVINQGKEKQ